MTLAHILWRSAKEGKKVVSQDADKTMRIENSQIANQDSIIQIPMVKIIISIHMVKIDSTPDHM